MNDRCLFIESWRGRCNAAVTENGRCTTHASMMCVVCGAPATHDCDHTGQFVCGAPLCDNCEGHTDVNKPAGSWGFMNHSHSHRAKATPQGAAEHGR